MIITLIIKSYFPIILSIGLSALGVFLAGIYLIFKKSIGHENLFIEPPCVTETPPVLKNKEAISDIESLAQLTMQPETIIHDMDAIAGEDKIATQLDLARAYIETGKVKSAKQILQAVLAQGNKVEQQEAQYLLNFSEGR